MRTVRDKQRKRPTFALKYCNGKSKYIRGAKNIRENRSGKNGQGNRKHWAQNTQTKTKKQKTNKKQQQQHRKLKR